MVFNIKLIKKAINLKLFTIKNWSVYLSKQIREEINNDYNTYCWEIEKKKMLLKCKEFFLKFVKIKKKLGPPLFIIFVDDISKHIHMYISQNILCKNEVILNI